MSSASALGVMQLLATQSGAFMAALLIASSAHKLIRRAHTQAVVQQFAGVPQGLSAYAVAAVSLVEMRAGVLLIVPAQRATGAVLVDISIDQGGCFETSRPTTHAAPTFVVDGVIHYCVANMPGAVPRTSTYALTNATLPYVRSLADRGWRDALQRDPGLAAGLNVHAGQITHEAVAQALKASGHLLA